MYVNVDSPNLGFPYFNFLGGYQWKKHPVNILLLLNGCFDVCLQTSRAYLQIATMQSLTHKKEKHNIEFW